MHPPLSGLQLHLILTTNRWSVPVTPPGSKKAYLKIAEILENIATTIRSVFASIDKHYPFNTKPWTRFEQK